MDEPTDLKGEALKVSDIAGTHIGFEVQNGALMIAFALNKELAKAFALTILEVLEGRLHHG